MNLIKGPCVYILECADGTYYTGSTKHLENRLHAHHTGKGAKYVRGRGPAHVVYMKKYRYYKSALRAEWHLKQLTRKQKEMLVRQFQSVDMERSDA